MISSCLSASQSGLTTSWRWARRSGESLTRLIDVAIVSVRRIGVDQIDGLGVCAERLQIERLGARRALLDEAEKVDAPDPRT